jgi:tRNA dimethylallyltransferase
VNKPKLICVVGPTASGKTALAVQLAEQIGGEVINADSVQIYKHFDIGSGKPTPVEQKGISHHLLSVVEPTEELDASQFAEAAQRAISEVRSRGRTPIVCGGTFLWVKALLYGLAPAPSQNADVRARHLELSEREGRPALHQRLALVDPQSAARLNPNDFVRVSRALEIFELTGTPMTAYLEAHGFREALFDAQLVGIRHELPQLHARIEQRVRNMFAEGWLDEVRALKERGLGETRPMSSVGYRQVYAAVLAGRGVDSTLIEEVAQVTRVFSRRQRTWLRDLAVHWIAPSAVTQFHAPDAWV